MSKWILQLLIVLFALITVSGLCQRHWGMMLYGLGATILNIGVLVMK